MKGITQTTTSCEFNSKKCINCANYTMCSLLNAENHLNKLENQINNIFNSLNSLIEFSVENGEKLKTIQEELPSKEDVLEEFSLVYKELDRIKETFVSGNRELKSLITQCSGELKSIMTRLSSVEKILLNEQGKK